MEGVHRVVYGRGPRGGPWKGPRGGPWKGPRGGPWTGGQCFQLSPVGHYCIPISSPEMQVGEIFKFYLSCKTRIKEKKKKLSESCTDSLRLKLLLKDAGVNDNECFE